MIGVGKGGNGASVAQPVTAQSSVCGVVIPAAVLSQCHLFGATFDAPDGTGEGEGAAQDAVEGTTTTSRATPTAAASEAKRVQTARCFGCACCGDRRTIHLHS